MTILTIVENEYKRKRRRAIEEEQNKDTFIK